MINLLRISSLKLFAIIYVIPSFLILLTSYLGIFIPGTSILARIAFFCYPVTLLIHLGVYYIWLLSAGKHLTMGKQSVLYFILRLFLFFNILFLLLILTLILHFAGEYNFTIHTPILHLLIIALNTLSNIYVEILSVLFLVSLVFNFYAIFHIAQRTVQIKRTKRKLWLFLVIILALILFPIGLWYVHPLIKSVSAPLMMPPIMP